MSERFDLEKAIAAWRRTLEHTRAVSAEDLRELECHLRDQLDWLRAEGRSEADAFRQAVRDVGDFGTTEAEYAKTYWRKERHGHRFGRALILEANMLTNYVRLALRNLLKRKGYAALNLFGLAAGIAASLLIFQYVAHELSYDDFLVDGERLYRVRFDAYRDGERLFKSASAFPVVGPAMKADFPEVEEYARLFLRWGGGTVRVGDRSFKEPYLYTADSLFLRLFSYPMVRGDRNTALNEPNTAVISTEAAAKYFGDQDPVGQRFRFGNDEEYVITGVAESPEESHLKFGFLLSWATMRQRIGHQFDDAWGWYDFYIFLKLRPGVDPAALEAKFPDFVARHGGGEEAKARTTLLLQPVRDIHLHSDLIQEARPNGDATSVYVLGVVAFFILVIAWVNYVNLATARAMERAKEIGIRKVVGAHRQQLVRQFLLESVLLNALAAALGLGLAALALPAFRGLTGSMMTLELVRDARLWAAFGALFVVGTFASGLYPAFVLSAYRPVQVLKGSLARARQGAALRRVLVVGQFVASIALIAGTMIVYRQVTFMRSQSLGVDLEQTLVVEGPAVVESDSVYAGRFAGFKEALLRHPRTESVAASTEIPGNLIFWTNGILRQGQTYETAILLYRVGVDYDYLSSYGHRVVAGRTFSRDFPTDDRAVVLNETTVRMLGFGSPDEAVDQPVVVGGDTLSVIGVVADYHQEGLHRAFDPVGFSLLPTARSYFSVRVRTDALPETVAHVRDTYEAFFPENPFTHYFLDDHFARQYRAYDRFGRTFGLFAGLAIVVACLGLFGLSSFTAAQRTKEIGIRKVLGSTVPDLILLLTKDFLKLVVLAAFIATPLVWFGMQQWLERFAFRTGIAWWTFVAAGLAALAIALATVGYQTLRAATTDPAKALRYE